MSEDRETRPAGSPVEETEASLNEVLAAVERAKDARTEPETAGGERLDDEGSIAVPAEDLPPVGEPVEREETGAAADRSESAVVVASTGAAGPSNQSGRSLGPEPATERTSIVELEELPSAGPTERDADAAGLPGLDSVDAPEREAARERADAERDGEIRISADHPMAALYMQTPMPPELRGNRGAGVLIAVLATLGFALVYAGVLALWAAPELAPSQFVDGIVEQLTSWSFIAAAAAFLVGLIVLVLVVGRAGWWAYVLGGFLVGALVWFAGTAGGAVDRAGFGALLERSPLSLVDQFGLAVPAIAAGLVAREATIWFGAWIGARGRRMTAKNAELLAEYETALAEVRAKKP
ncbi:hypothetical protein JD276_10955 [Leucobacter sp. CSA1]|uniref:Uncharacterized protein n=1 Tax=Leucobacter chromiisoli TaxID=2796471 RepID=A0A934UVT4_9MICO|nr:hypothetical protein [Leucobacter chromiisoli]MBK0419553.1 hypothetical protein [Leucobacter chromiisoli]